MITIEVSSSSVTLKEGDIKIAVVPTQHDLSDYSHEFAGMTTQYEVEGMVSALDRLIGNGRSGWY